MTKKGVVLLVCVFSYVWPEPTASEMVWLKDITASIQTDKRTLGDLDLPNDLTFNLRHGSRNLTLNLERNHGINPNANVYFVRKLKDGRQLLQKALNLEKEDIAYYQDRENGAFMTARCVRRSNGHCDRVINGNIRMDDRNYDLRPAETNITSRDLLDTPDLRGTRYVLRHKANIQKDFANVSENKIEIELRDLLIRFHQEQDKGKHFTSPVTSRNVSHLHNGATRNLKHVYYVEIDVVLDSGVWDFYSSLFQNDHNTVDSRHEERKIRELFSHIINGVSMLYRNIEDPSIAIRISIREFYIFKARRDFKHIQSVVTEIEGRDYIDYHKYLNDLSDWTAFFRSFSDHVMLFTKFDLYDGSIDNGVSGGSFNGFVCDRLYKVSVVQVREYFLTVSTAAHELGHNLGAEHDGDGKAEACKAEDLFIMSPDEPQVGFDKTKPYSPNPWMFSNCSVEAFKETLGDKMCLSNKGVFYDWEEWKHFIRNEPGQVYSTDRQCEMIHGRGSVFCGTVSADICNFMKCTDPKTNLCIWKFFRAARGTSCGEDMWCMRGQCVSRGGFFP